VGGELGDKDGLCRIDGTSDFILEGLFDGVGVGGELGDMDGLFVGRIDGTSDFILEGRFDGVGVEGEMERFVGGEDGEESSPPPHAQHA